MPVHNFVPTETVKVDHYFAKGQRSEIVVEGNRLDIYCDTHGIDKKEFESGNAKITWTKGIACIPSFNRKLSPNDCQPVLYAIENHFPC